MAHRLRSRPDDLRQHGQDRLDDRRLVELTVRLRTQGERLSFCLAFGQHDAGLCVAFQGRLLGSRLRGDLHDAGLRLTGQLHPLGVSLCLSDDRALDALGSPDLRRRLRLRRPDDRRDQLLLLARGFQLGQFGLLSDDLLGRLGLRQRTCLRGSGLGSRGLGLRLRAAQGDVPLGIDLDLLGFGFADGGFLVCRGLGDARVTLATGRLLLTDQVHIPGLVADRLDRERIDLQAGRRQVALGGILDSLLELHPVQVQFLDGERAHDGAQGAFQNVLDDGIDRFLLGLQEALGGVADGLVVCPDLEGRHALDRHFDALPGDRVGQVHVDLPGGQFELSDLVDEGQDDDATTTHDLEIAPAVRAAVALAGNDERLVRAGDLVATADVADDQDDDDDDHEDRDHPAPDEIKDPVKHLTLPRWPARSPG